MKSLYGSITRSAVISFSYVTFAMLPRVMVRNGLAERERKNFHARAHKFNLELAIGDGLRLSD
jgi:hypothetical protein